MTGVSDAVTAPPICPPMFITPETDPEERPAMSAVTDQNELCDRYSAPAPPARTTLASRVLATSDPVARKTAVSSIAMAPRPLRPTRALIRDVSASFISPPMGHVTAIARKGRDAYHPLAFRLSPRTSAR